MLGLWKSWCFPNLCPPNPRHEAGFFLKPLRALVSSFEKHGTEQGTALPKWKDTSTSSPHDRRGWSHRNRIWDPARLAYEVHTAAKSWCWDLNLLLSSWTLGVTLVQPGSWIADWSVAITRGVCFESWRGLHRWGASQRGWERHVEGGHSSTLSLWAGSALSQPEAPCAPSFWNGRLTLTPQEPLGALSKGSPSAEHLTGGLRSMGLRASLVKARGSPWIECGHLLHRRADEAHQPMCQR